MNTELFAEWLRRRGHRVVRTESSHWYNAAPGVFQAFPYHWTITPSEAEVRELMLRHGGLALRYSAPFDAPRGVASYHVVVNEPYSLDHLKPQARNGIRAGLGRFGIERISFERLATEGWALQQDTLARQERVRSMTEADWRRTCAAASGLPGFEAWAATSNGELAAALMSVRQGTVFSVPFALSHRRFLAEHVNNALFYAVSRELLQREGVEGIFYTVQSLDAPSNVDEFKFRMGLRPKLVRQCVDFNPLIRPFALPAVHRWTQRLLDRDPSNPSLAKAEGMMRFYLEGLKPLEDQVWPPRLEPERRRLVPEPALLADAKSFQVTTATRLDLNALVDLHVRCFTGHDHIPVRLGKAFIEAVYRWFLASPDICVLVARQGERIIGFTTLADRPYNLPMMRACRRELIRGCLRHPGALFHREIVGRALRMFARSKPQAQEQKVAQIAFTAVDEDYRRLGVGKALKDASIRVCRERGMAAVTTGVRRKNHRARQLNERAGFVEVPAQSTDRLIHLRLELRPPLPSEEATAPGIQRRERRARVRLPHLALSQPVWASDRGGEFTSPGTFSHGTRA
ncbi:GNAT family N-acetyltransferase [Geothrix sp. 21YS21S-4]|uniref:GNAT family N-acetyltransferase n=1 Tax=Geothrix sp. 21YS21S-4 TaxID=3068889 RepID=UPI0027B93246|nr:GNAT family N-acetyltransferase [Geothrix sp. 21YS21S-4]